MYAIVALGGKQYKVSEGETFQVEKMDVETGKTVEVDAMLISKDGKVSLKGKVSCEVLGHGKEKKVVVYKYKAKKNERKRQGHRQPFTALKVKSITA